MAQYQGVQQLSASAKAAMTQQLQFASGQAAASAFSDTFKVVVAVAIVGTLMGIVLRRTYPAEETQQPAIQVA